MDPVLLEKCQLNIKRCDNHPWKKGVLLMLKSIAAYSCWGTCCSLHVCFFPGRTRSVSQQSMVSFAVWSAGAVVKCTPSLHWKLQHLHRCSSWGFGFFSVSEVHGAVARWLFGANAINNQPARGSDLQPGLHAVLHEATRPCPQALLH